jgi:hypothetical protein
MKIHSDILTPTDILACVPMGCHLAVFEHDSRATNIGQAGSRQRKQAFVVRLSGSSRYALQGMVDRGEKAATWDEWGNFIDAIFTQDPNAICGQYKSRDDFMAQSADEYNRVKLYMPDRLPTHSAPWLAHN